MKPDREDERRLRRDLSRTPRGQTLVFAAVRLARGLRYKNWPAVAEYMDRECPV